ncbi:MAG: hypothetical protein IM613_06905 [Cytophagales bacterium]|nr:hypothetical protein [Cytophagales bacterium]
METILLFDANTMKVVTDGIMNAAIPLQAGATILIAVCIVAHLAVLAIKLMLKPTQGNHEQSVTHILTVIFYWLAMLSYNEWAPQLRVFANIVANQFQPTTENKTYRKQFYDQLNKNRVAKENAIAKNVETVRKSFQSTGPLNGTPNPWGGGGTSIDPGASSTPLTPNSPQAQSFNQRTQLELDAYQLSETVKLHRKTPENSIVGDVADGAAAFVFLTVGYTASSILLPLVRDLGQLLVDVFTCLVLLFLPLTFVHSAIPGAKGHVFEVILLLLAVQLWVVGRVAVDSLMFVFEDNMTLLLMSSDPADRNLVGLYNFVFIGLYVGLPALIAVFWPSTGSNVATLLNVGVTMAVKTAIEGGKKIITKT